MKLCIAISGLLMIAVSLVAAPVEYAGRINSLSEATSQVGRFPNSRGQFVQSPCVLTELRRILGAHHASYREHLKLAGCGMLEQDGDFVVVDISQLHVGGYGSLIYIDVRAEKMYLFWLKESVAERNWQIYGDRPIPKAVLASIARRMNGEWGHVATFEFFGEYLIIKMKTGSG